MELTKEKIRKIEDYLSSLGDELNIDILYFIEVEDIDLENSFDSLYKILENQSAFDEDVIYYSEAIKFLAENDSSLKDSLQLAEELGYTNFSLSSEVLASILKSNIVREDFSGKEGVITEFFLRVCSSLQNNLKSLQNENKYIIKNRSERNKQSTSNEF